MIPFERALKIILDDMPALDSEVVRLTDSLGRIAARTIYSPSAVPAFDNSAMDGYALRCADTRGASRKAPKALEVIAEIKAGSLSGRRIKNNQAMRIMTGAVMPRGTDGVVMVEDTRKIKNSKFKIEKRELVGITTEIGRGKNVRYAGEDIKKGEPVIKKGTLLTPSHLGILASVGIADVTVSKKPRVAILVTGDEIVEVADKLKKGQLHNSNTYTLCGQVIKSGGVPKNLGIAKDSIAQLEKKIRCGLHCDMILTSGGVSVGDYDFVRDVLIKIGARIRFWKVAMRPGKPLAFARIGTIPVFGLPGNPVSGMVCFELFVRPAIAKMLGHNHDNQKEAEAILEEDITKKQGLRYLLRANTYWKNGAYHTKTTGPQGSGILKSMALANSLIILPEDREGYNKGNKVRVRFLE